MLSKKLLLGNGEWHSQSSCAAPKPAVPQRRITPKEQMDSTAAAPFCLVKYSQHIHTLHHLAQHTVTQPPANEL